MIVMLVNVDVAYKKTERKKKKKKEKRKIVANKNDVIIKRKDRLIN